jgi:ADP-ribose pyrophosphatase YjhB (NUDIX family)
MPDPAAGKFEFPSGHIEGQETPRQAAVREWQEETGLQFPDGEWTGSWTSPNGVYQGFVLTIPHESDLDIVFDRMPGTNPDLDPDGDGAEAILFMDPSDLPGNPAVRMELLENIDAVMAALGCTPDCCGGECCQGDGGCCGGLSGCACGPKAPDGSAVSKAAGPPKGDPDDWAGIWARTHERRTKLLAKHERAVLAAWNDLAGTLSPRTLVRQFREGTGQVVKLAGPDRPWWKDRGRDAALAWLLTLQQKKGWAALVAALGTAIADGMAEGEADSLAVAADRQGVKDFSLAAAFAAAAQALQGDPEVSQQAQDTAQGILEGVATALSVTLADGAEKGASEAAMAAAVTSAVTGPGVAPVKYGLADALWSAAGSGLTRLIGRLTGRSPAPSPGSGAAPSPPPEEPEAGPAMINWVCEGGSPCATCQDNQGGSPYAPDDVPQYLAHDHCMCALYLASNVPSSFFYASLLQ